MSNKMYVRVDGHVHMYIYISYINETSNSGKVGLVVK